MNYRDLTVDELVQDGLNVKNEKLSPLLQDKGILSTIKRKGYKVISISECKEN